MNTRGFFQHLSGNWNFERSIIEGSSTWLARGEATFKVVENETDTLSYHEQGQLERAPNQSIEFYRDYVYRYHGEQAAIAVYFVESGRTDRLFYTLQFQSDNTTAQGEHHCNKDIYRTTYELIDENFFEIYYQVKGPQKDYQLRTFFRRVVAKQGLCMSSRQTAQTHPPVRCVLTCPASP